MAKVELKQPIVQAIADDVKDAASVVLVDYRGLTVAQDTELRKDDATAPARILCKFAKDAKALELKAGVVEGTVYDSAALNELSKIPSREELLSKLLGSLQSPITNLARVLNQIAEQGGAQNCTPASSEAPAEEAVEAPAE